MRRGRTFARRDETAGRRLACDKSVVSVAYPDRADSRSQRTSENRTLKMLWIIGLSHSTTVTGIEDANMQHQRSEGFRMERTVLGFPSLVILIAGSLLAATALAQSYPTQSYPTTPAYSAPNTYRPPQRHVARGAARGAAVGAVGGAITGDPAKGAAAGAAMGGTAGAFRRRDERRQQAIQQQPMQAPLQ